MGGSCRSLAYHHIWSVESDLCVCVCLWVHIQNTHPLHHRNAEDTKTKGTAFWLETIPEMALDQFSKRLCSRANHSFMYMVSGLPFKHLWFAAKMTPTWMCILTARHWSTTTANQRFKCEVAWIPCPLDWLVRKRNHCFASLFETQSNPGFHSMILQTFLMKPCACPDLWNRLIFPRLHHRLSSLRFGPSPVLRGPELCHKKHGFYKNHWWKHEFLIVNW